MRSSVEIIFRDGDELRALVLDAVPEERHSMTARATEHEVERGVSVTDHVLSERRTFTLDAVISDVRLTSPETERTRAVDAWAQLLDARDRALVAAVTTELDTYPEMVLTEASTTKTAADRSWIRVSLTFTQIRQVSTETVDDPVPARPRDRRPVDTGSQATTPVERTRRQQAILARVLFGP